VRLFLPFQYSSHPVPWPYIHWRKLILARMKTVCPDRAPRTIGPYVHAAIHGDLVFTTACIPLDPETMQIVGGGPENQLRQIFENLKIILGEAGTSLDRILKQNVYLTDFEDFEVFNKISAEYLGEHKPARATMKVLELPKKAPMALDVIAALPDKKQQG
jgi:2-iminobutanoate/2-iminopropanoate deaminase